MKDYIAAFQSKGVVLYCYLTKVWLNRIWSRSNRASTIAIYKAPEANDFDSVG